MGISKVVCEAIPFAQALRAALVVGDKKEPRDLVQFRLVDGDLVIAAGTHSDVVSMVVPTTFISADEERDGCFEVTRAEAVALSAMKMKKDPEDHTPLLGLSIDKSTVLRTDESGLGLGVRMVRVRRHGELYESVLGNIPGVVTRAINATPSERLPEMLPYQWGLVSKVSAALDTRLSVFTPSVPGADVVRNIASAYGVGMVMLTPVLDEEDIDDDGTSSPEKLEPALNFDDPLEQSSGTADDSEVVSADKKPGLRVVAARPPEGMA